MPLLLVLLFVTVPLLEIVVLLQVGGAIGAPWTIALLIGASLLGAALLRIEGRRAWSQFREALAAGRWPGDEVAQGALVILGGALLLTPGFLTDGVGLLLLLPPTRRVVSRLLRGRVTDRLAGQGSTRRRGSARTGRRGRSAAGRPGDPRIVPLDVEVVEVEREDTPPGRATDDDDPKAP